jgi:GH15 family glucan-1,4-alpha-glucosidase
VRQAIADYALIGDTRTAALVGRDGSIDWFCAPRFDSPACFAALLGNRDNGRWLLAPEGPVRHSHRDYRHDSLVLDTQFDTHAGSVQVSDCMLMGASRPTLLRLVTGLSGTVRMRTEAVLRFDYGSVVPWVTHDTDGLRALGGPDAVVLRSPVRLTGHDFASSSTFDVSEGQRLGFVMTHHHSFEAADPLDDEVGGLVDRTERWWRDWMQGCAVQGRWADAVRRSAITLKALTYQPTGGIVAAPTTSLPEQLGGSRNWDYRYSWLRDATFTLYALMIAGFTDEATAWRRWLLRAAAGRPQDLRIAYGVDARRRLPEQALHWLPGYHDSSPVRVGNAAGEQFQLDVYGEVLDVLHLARRIDGGGEDVWHAWDLQRGLLDYLEQVWTRPDHSIWEVRDRPAHFTYSKVMAWVAFDRAAKAVERHGMHGPGARWRRVADQIRADVLQRGFDERRGSFVQSYGSDRLDAALLMLAPVGFLPATDLRIRGTVAAVERELLDNGLMRRYLPDPSIDGQHEDEGVFLACSFWLADNYQMQGRHDEAVALFERLLGLANDVGLLSEECHASSGALLGNFPQALTHVALINTAHNLSLPVGPARHRGSENLGQWPGER